MAARSAAQSSRSIVRNRLSASIHRPYAARRWRAATVAMPRAAPQAARRLPDAAVARRRSSSPRCRRSVAGQRVAVLDPACGDGRFLVAAAPADSPGPAARRARDRHRPRRGGAARRPSRAGGAHVEVGDALAHDWGDATFDVVVGNPPYLSQLAAATTRGGASRHGGGPYADAAAEFLALAVAPRRPAGGRVGSCCRSRSSPPATPGRCGPRSSAGRADLVVVVAAIALRRRGLRVRRRLRAANFREPQRGGGDRDPVWTGVVTTRHGRSRRCPRSPSPAPSATMPRSRPTSVTSTTRGDHGTGPLLVTSGAIDPDRCRWGQRPVTFNRRRFLRPRVDVSQLDERMRRWAPIGGAEGADRQPDPHRRVRGRSPGTMLPAVPVLTARPTMPGDTELSALAAVLSSPLASVWLWHAAAGTGLSRAPSGCAPPRLPPCPWPQGSLTSAIAAYDAGDLVGARRRSRRLRHRPGRRRSVAPVVGGVVAVAVAPERGVTGRWWFGVGSGASRIRDSPPASRRRRSAEAGPMRRHRGAVLAAVTGAVMLAACGGDRGARRPVP